MTEFEYLLVLVSVLIGMAISDLAGSVHRLFVRRHRIQWDWLSPTAAALTLLTIMRFWWKFYRYGQAEIWTHFGPFLLLLTQLFQLVLLACAALPDEGKERDLRDYYQTNSRYFWLLFSSYTLLAVVFNWISSSGPADQKLLPAAINLVYVLVFGSLAFVRNRTYHGTVLVLMLTSFLILFFPQELA